MDNADNVEEDALEREHPSPEEVTSPALRSYRRAARRLGIVPLRSVMSQFGKKNLSFRDLLLSPLDIKATCMALMTEHQAVVEMDLSGNSLPLQEYQCLVKVFMKTADSLRYLNLSNTSLTGNALRHLGDFLQRCDLSDLNLSGNKLSDADAQILAHILTVNNSIRTLILNHNEFREAGGRLLGTVIGKSKHIEVLELSWNHLRMGGAIGIAKGLEANQSLLRVDLSWNGFGFEGCVALGDMLARNRTLKELDISSNRIHPPALLEVSRGLARNKTLQVLKVGVFLNVRDEHSCRFFQGYDLYEKSLESDDSARNFRNNLPRLVNDGFREIPLKSRRTERKSILEIIQIGNNPITASFTSVLLNSIKKHPTVGLVQLDMQGIVVDRDFQSILDDIRHTRCLLVNYDLILPVKAVSREEMLKRIQAPGAYNLDPLHMFFLLKEKMRASDFFHKINKDNNEGVSRQELHMLFMEAGIPVTGSVLDKILEFMDTNEDGTIDIGEFMTGDRKMKRISRNLVKHEQERKATGEDYRKYSRSFKKAQLDPYTLSLKVPVPTSHLPPLSSKNEPFQPPQDENGDNSSRL